MKQSMNMNPKKLSIDDAETPDREQLDEKNLSEVPPEQKRQMPSKDQEQQPKKQERFPGQDETLPGKRSA